MFVGVATEDSIAVVERYPQADQRVVAERIVFGGGGPAATAAVAATRLGVPSAVVAAVGDDDEGRLVRARLEAEGVDVSGIMTVPGAETSRSVVIISGEQQSRAIVNRPGPALSLKDDAVARALMDHAEWIHVDQHGWHAVHEIRDLLRPGSRLSVDAGNDIPGLELGGTDLYAPTREAIERRYGRGADLDALMRAAVDEGARSVVVTDGGRGSRGLSIDGEAASVTAPAAEIVSTLGAGDVFHGALIAGLLHVEDGTLAGGFTAALSYATTVATLSCRGIDGRSAIPRHQEVMDLLSTQNSSDQKDRP